MRLFLIIAALFGLTGVAAGAFGTHALADLLGESGREGTFATAVRYQMFHGLALLAVAILLGQWPDSGLLRAAGWLFSGGILIFSGSLYLLIVTGQRWLGAVTPIGGAAFLAGWAFLAWFAWRLT